jgi:hypothetical protein
MTSKSFKPMAHRVKQRAKTSVWAAMATVHSVRNWA